MPNKLEKLPPSQGGGGGGGGGGDGGGGTGPNPGVNPSLPPQDTPCFSAIQQQVYLLWPNCTITLVVRDDGSSYFSVKDPFTGWVWTVTGTCANGYVKLSYTVYQPTGPGSDT